MSSSLITPRRQQSLGVELVPSRSILLVTHRVPFPPDKGDRIRTFNLIRFLARDHRVFLASLADEPIDSEALRNLKEWCEEIVICPLGGI